MYLAQQSQSASRVWTREEALGVSRRVTTTARITLETSLAHVFDIVTGTETLPEYFHGDGPFPGVVRAEILGGARLQTGAIRRLTLTDGSTKDEEIISHLSPLRFTYRALTGTDGDSSSLIRGITSDWMFVPCDGKVEVIYETHFDAASRLALPLVLFLARVRFRRVQEDCLQRIAELVYTLPDDIY